MSMRAPYLAARRLAVFAAPLLLPFAGCGGDGGDGAAQRAAPTATDCSALASVAGLPNPTTTIVSTTFNAASAPVAEHCQINGAINSRTGVDSQKYAINFRLRLPTTWNGRLYMGGGGGTDGTRRRPGEHDGTGDDAALAGIRHARHRQRPRQQRRQQPRRWRHRVVRRRSAGADRLRFQRVRPDRAGRQGADRPLLRQGARPLVLRRLLGGRPRGDGDVAAVPDLLRRHRRWRPRLSPAARGDRRRAGLAGVRHRGAQPGLGGRQRQASDQQDLQRSGPDARARRRARRLRRA